MKNLSRVLFLNLAALSIGSSCAVRPVVSKSARIEQSMVKEVDLNTAQAFKVKQLTKYTNLLNFKSNKEDFDKNAKKLFLRETISEQDVQTFLNNFEDFKDSVSPNAILRLRKLHATLSLDQKRKIINFFYNLNQSHGPSVSNRLLAQRL